MKIKEIEDYFGSSVNFVKKTGMARTCWFAWRRKGFVPIKSQFRLEAITGGQLKADYKDAGV